MPLRHPCRDPARRAPRRGITDIPTTRALLERPGTLLITRPRPGAAAEPDGSNRGPALNVFLAVLDDKSVLAFNGHVDLGTGIRTALAQIVAEELDAEFDSVTVVLGDTEHAPDQGPTIASETIQITAVPLRIAAAQARALLLDLAASRLGCPAAALTVAGGMVVDPAQPGQPVSYAALLHGQTLRAELAGAAALKPAGDYRLVGSSVPRTDIPAKAMGSFSYVHDLRLPGMLHGRVIRPPYLGYDSGAFVGRCLAGVDEASVDTVHGLVAVITVRDFVGVVHQPDAGCRDGDRRLLLPGVRAGHAARHRAGWPQPVSGVSLYRLRQDDRRGPVGAVCPPDGAARRPCGHAGHAPGVPVQPPPADGGLEPAVPSAWRDLRADSSEGARLFQGACGGCHHRGDGPPVLGVNVALSLNSGIHSDRPDNLVRVILAGIADPAQPGLGHMPGFADSLGDRQVEQLAQFLRRRFAPDKPPWADVAGRIGPLRGVP